MKRSLFDRKENTRGFANGFSTDGSPWDFVGVSACEKLDLGSVYDKAVSVNSDFALVLSVNGIILEEVASIVDRKKRVVHGNDSGVWVIDGSTAHKTSNTSESVDSKLNWHDDFILFEV